MTAPAAVPGGGELRINTTQSTFPTVSVAADGVLTGDDGATTVYKGSALGPWSASKDLRAELAAAPTSGNLKVNTDMLYGSNNGTTHLVVNGTLSGNTNFTSNSANNSVTVNGTLAPGNSVGAMTGNSKMIIGDGATYDLDVLDPSTGAGTGYDTITMHTVEFLGCDPSS